MIMRKIAADTNLGLAKKLDLILLIQAVSLFAWCAALAQRIS
jgi:hypothetical protein